MSTVSQVRTALGSTIRAAVTGLKVYDKVPDVTQVPCVVIRPGKCNYLIGGGRCQEWDYELYVLVARTETFIKQDQLDVLISATGSGSVVAALRAAPTLGLADTNVTVREMDQYGGFWESARVNHVGARLKLGILITE